MVLDDDIDWHWKKVECFVGDSKAWDSLKKVWILLFKALIIIIKTQPMDG